MNSLEWALRPPESPLKRILSVWRRHRLVYFKYFWANVLPPFLEPLMFILALGVGLAAYMELVQGVPYAVFLAPGMIAASPLFSASFEATYGTYMRMEYEHIYDAILATPVSFGEMVAGEVLWLATKSSMFSAGVLLVVTLAGLIESWWSLLVIPVGFAGGVVFALMGLLVTSRVREINNFNFYLTGIITPMFYFSGAVFPLAVLPLPLQAFAWLLPMTHLVALMRACTLCAFQPVLLAHLAVLATFGAALWPLAKGSLRRRIVV